MCGIGGIIYKRDKVLPKHLNRDYFNLILRQHFDRIQNHPSQIWNPFWLNLWFKVFIENEIVSSMKLSEVIEGK